MYTGRQPSAAPFLGKAITQGIGSSPLPEDGTNVCDYGAEHMLGVAQGWGNRWGVLRISNGGDAEPRNHNTGL